jgi:hypothetical protein
MMQRSSAGKRFRRYFILAEEYLRLRISHAPSVRLQELISNHQSYNDEIALRQNNQDEEHAESHYQKLLEEMFDGRLCHRRNTHGQMDIHTESEIFEVKRWSNYKHALGQLLAYNEEHSKQLVVVLFGTLPEEDQSAKIRRIFVRYDIKVLYFDDKDKLHEL